MFQSAEIRWFVPEALPTEVLQWFGAGQAVDSEGTREDQYLVFPGCDTVGVKLREGKLEVKAMLSPSRPIDLAEGINGRTDQWIKWSLDSKALSILEDELLQSGRWIRVRKTRFLRKFSLDSDTPVEVPVWERPFPSKGCIVELTRVGVGADLTSWFSLGFEAFGPGRSDVGVLYETARHFFHLHGSMPGVRLTGREALSYPAWLATLG